MILSNWQKMFNAPIDLSAISGSGAKGNIIKVQDGFNFDGVKIADSDYGWKNTITALTLYVMTDAVQASGSSELTVVLYEADTTNGSTPLTKKIAEFGPFKQADINRNLLSDGVFFKCHIPTTAKNVIQAEVKGTAFTSGTVRVALEVEN